MCNALKNDSKWQHNKTQMEQEAKEKYRERKKKCQCIKAKIKIKFIKTRQKLTGETEKF